jgi:hypothetical protein
MKTTRIQHHTRASWLAILLVAGWCAHTACGDELGPFVNSPNPTQKYSGGKGTPEEPYRIGCPADLVKLSTTPGHWDECFKLVSDLDLEHKNLKPIGRLREPFTGSFDGGYRCIKNLVVYDDGSGVGGAGLFGFVRGSEALLSAVILENATIIGNADNDVGALVGRLEGGTIYQCGIVGGRIFAGVGRDSRAGGLAGVNAGGSILECSSTALVEGTSACGGLVGNNEEGGTIQDCYAAGRVALRPLCLVDQPYRCGGLIGVNRGNVSFCYADTPVSVLPPDTCTGHRGGFIGAAIMAAYPNVSWVLFCYSNEEYAPPVGASDVPSTGARAISRGMLTQRDTFKHWDFEVIWCIQPNTMPRLQWEKR